VWRDAQAETDKVGAIVRPQGEREIVPDLRSQRTCVKWFICRHHQMGKLERRDTFTRNDGRRLVLQLSTQMYDARSDWDVFRYGEMRRLRPTKLEPSSGCRVNGRSCPIYAASEPA
jgi:hypothetical protein